MSETAVAVALVLADREVAHLREAAREIGELRQQRRALLAAQVVVEPEYDDVSDHATTLGAARRERQEFPSVV